MIRPATNQVLDRFKCRGEKMKSKKLGTCLIIAMASSVAHAGTKKQVSLTEPTQTFNTAQAEQKAIDPTPMPPVPVTNEASASPEHTNSSANTAPVAPVDLRQEHLKKISADEQAMEKRQDREQAF